MTKPMEAEVSSLLASLLLAANLYVPPSAAAIPPTEVGHHAASVIAVEVHGQLASIYNTHSMEPTITSADLCVVVPVKETELKVGDIVVVDLPGPNLTTMIVLHRVKQKLPLGYFITRGDHNGHDDLTASTDHNLKGLVVAVVDGQTGEVKYRRAQ